MDVLNKWWDQFKTHAPISDEEMGDFCCVVVGNKLDLVQKDSQIVNGSAIRVNGHVNGMKKKPVSREEAEVFLKKLVPPEFIKQVTMPEVVLPSEHEEVLMADELEAVSEDDEDPMSASQLTARPRSSDSPIQDSTTVNHASVPKTESIAINGNSINFLDPRVRRDSSSSSPSFPRAIHRSKSQSNSRSRSVNSRIYPGTAGTVTTVNSGFSIYHTPSSSVYDQFESARTSPEPWEASSSGSPVSASYTSGSVLRSSSPASGSGSGSSGSRPPRRRILSAGSKNALSIDSIKTRSTSSVATVTPSLYAREHDEHEDDWDHQGTVASSAASFFSALSGSLSNRSTTPDKDLDRMGKFKHSPLRLQIQSNHFVPPPKPPTPIPPDCGPRLFFTSAKTGEGVKDVFEYIAKRVVTRWEWEERAEAGRFEFREVGDGTWSRSRGGSWGRRTGQGIKLGRSESGRGRSDVGVNWSASCCS